MVGAGGVVENECTVHAGACFLCVLKWVYILRQERLALRQTFEPLSVCDIFLHGSWVAGLIQRVLTSK